jgi:hypothetical protein
MAFHNADIVAQEVTHAIHDSHFIHTGEKDTNPGYAGFS